MSSWGPEDNHPLKCHSYCVVPSFTSGLFFYSEPEENRKLVCFVFVFFSLQFNHSLVYAIKLLFFVCDVWFLSCYTSFILLLIPINFIYHLGKEICGCRVRVTVQNQH